MIQLTKLNGTGFILNADLIETIDYTPDTVITLINNKKIVVKESPHDIIEKVINYRRRIFGR
ncbi:Swarming motility protein SwrD [Koleobacter methoxysyntrophicus]|jgi:flagellar protein FlbD|uniref:Swarming motility protein SwrD n=1 Tax=Koleobacter methoxysyntrophicus TaxID=2751313 RepID=A0A8A0RQP5_9FIRM|nr:flagellar FlbD family protein [Koleobacter methoxysyntrophicus]MDI3540535.1 flagellar protein FlbD [Thermosediminibacterales bacterium]QSQ09890.1 Swarming motility protein SwrD [Koleobacter methoxysyntrophicus]